jgi:hypothetical protein
MSTFLQGFQSGQYFFSERNKQALQAEELALRQSAEERVATEFKDKQTDRTRLLGMQRATDAAWSDRQALEKDGVMTGNTSGMSDASAQMLYGQGGQQAVDDTASYGNAESVRFGQRPTMTTSGGATPDAPAAPTVAMRTATDRDRVKSDLRIATAAQNMEATTAAQTRMRDLDKRDIYDEVGKMSDAEIHAQLPGLNSAEMSGLPIYDAGDVTDDKSKPTGYRELKIIKDGKSQLIQVSPAQLRQIAIAHQMMKKGFGEEGVSMLSGVSKDMAELVGKYNTTLKGSVDTGNVVRGHIDDNIDKAAGRKETERHNKAGEGHEQRMEDITKAHYETMAKVYGRAKDRPQKVSVMQKDPDTGKMVKVEKLARWDEENKKFEYFDVPEGMDTSGVGEVDPQIHDLMVRRQGIIGKYGDPNTVPMADKQLADIDAQVLLIRHKNELAKMGPEERIAEVKHQIANKANSATLAALGITPEDVKAANAAPGKVVPGKGMSGKTTEPEASTSQAPVRSTDGGKTWGLDLPKTVRKPNVPYYQEVPNPLLGAMSGRTFKSRKEAEAAYAEATK